MLANTGERQNGERIEQIKPNHVARYTFAATHIRSEFKNSEGSIKILDSACGIGYGTNLLANSIDCECIGVDIFPDAIEVAERCYKLENSKYDILDLGSESSWKYGEKEFDAIVSIETIEHVLDAESLIARFARSTDFLIASVPNQNIVPFNQAKHPFHHRHYTKEEFEQLLNNHGFEVELWATQYDKIPGTVYEADDGMGFIVSARIKK